ncbi:MAG: Lipid II flippase MurJ [Chlamydiae bacterium]|nr:Lipid II flippase MurJ [Chlamydiota bacterium]
MNQDTHQFVSRASLKFFSGTFLSRISGMLRDMSMAFCFGTAAPLAAFLLVYRFVYLIRRLLGEGLLHQGFIPYFETKKAIDPKKGALFFRDLFWSLALLLGILVFASEITLSFFKGETIQLAMWMLPGIFFICLFGLATGLLHAEKSFFLPSVSPVASNGVWILGVVLLARLEIHHAVKGLAMILSFAFFVQWVMTVPKTWSYLRSHLSVKEIFSTVAFSAELKELIRPLLLGVVGVAAVQINSVIDGIFVRFADLEGPAYLWYAIRLQQLPLALFGIALSTALLPSLSRAVEEGAMERYRSLLDFAKTRAFTLIFPCVIGIFVLGLPSVNLLFGRGGFSPEATYQTTLCLWCYGVGLLPAAFVQVLAPGFYAKKNYRIPTLGFVYASLINVGLNALLIFYFKLGAASVALATSASALFNMIYLWKKLGQPTAGFPAMAKVGLCAILAGGAALLFGYFLLKEGTIPMCFGNLSFPRELPTQLLHLGLQAGIYFSIFFVLFLKIRPAEVSLEEF